MFFFFGYVLGYFVFFDGGVFCVVLGGSVFVVVRDFVVVVMGVCGSFLCCFVRCVLVVLGRVVGSWYL